MKLYKRKDFIKLKAPIIYSRVDDNRSEFMYGLFCMTENWDVDWIEQDLIGEVGVPDDISDGFVALLYQINLRDSFKEFTTDLECSGRDGMYDDDDVFVVWDKTDITKLRDYLNDCL